MKKKMTALVIGNAAYDGDGKLANPVNDATDIAKKLGDYGFDVETVTDANYKDMDKALTRFRAALATSEVGLFFFAGHGMQIDGVNYLLAIDTPMDDETDAKHGSLSLDKVIETLERSKVATKIIMLDACRNNPWKREWQRSASTLGLAPVYAPRGTIIGFATSPGQYALDGKGRNGTYTGAILQHIDEADCLIETMFKQVRNTVSAESKGKQITWEHTSLSGNFAFNQSLSKLITDYGPEALADALFVIDPAKKSHKVIAGLKSHNWYSQNDALALITAGSLTKASNDNLFVMGRNIYQAACGGSRAAEAFISNFIDRTAHFPAEKRKAILDGMLFEVFFDPDGQPRTAIKANHFSEVFALKKHKNLQSSFDFIGSALAASNAKLYAIPGGPLDVSVTITAKAIANGFRIEGVYVDGVNILRLEDEAEASDDEGNPIYVRTSVSQFEKTLSAQMKLPPSQLKLTYSPPEADEAGSLRVRAGFTVSK
ncbi:MULTISPECIES: caspase family protein [Stenotrophomonas]|uniref:caspase family protein n=2 Tax=Lysobacteraceae TaxID=32033 RepID=UPI00066BC85C|nr:MULTISPECIES: caspase family protein [Stenotrophomonas]MBH1694532.1 caspase family protein [Stenotrophomonas maltophilia]MDH0551877.1 caspase family protein [Stenotrophomonas sp. GD04006]HEJ4266741.1 caspase family protein [Pseudomonas aeruginosa]